MSSIDPSLDPEKTGEILAGTSSQIAGEVIRDDVSSDTGRIAIDSVQTDKRQSTETEQQKAERLAATKFKRLVRGKVGKDTEPDIDGYRERNFSLDLNNQLMPVDRVTFTTGKVAGSEDSKKKINVYEINLVTVFDRGSIIAYREDMGFTETDFDSSGSSNENPVDPERIIQVMDILGSADAEGRLRPEPTI